MKDIIKITVGTKKCAPAQCKTDLLVVGVFSDAKGLDKLNEELDVKLGGAIGKSIEFGDFEGKEKTSAMIYGEASAAKRILLVGLGEKKKVTLDTIRKAAALAANKAVELKAGKINIAVHCALGTKFDAAEIAKNITEGIYFGGYRYDEFVTETNGQRLCGLQAELVDLDLAKLKKLAKGVQHGTITGKAQCLARTLANRPGNVINPMTLAEEAKKIASKSKQLSCTVFNQKQMEEKGMGGILAVGSGSKIEPRFIVLKYTPVGRVSKNLPVVGLVGKAITFDSGGISIKPAANMEQMKLDKSGGIAVLAAMIAIAEMGIKLNVYGIVPAAENMPGGASYRPGDIVTTFSGKTVEVQNTDAEGRMILCDGLAYAVKQDCDVIVDIATLTGACVVALGKYMAGLMGNDEKLINQVQKAAQQSGEKVWHLPSGGEYTEDMKSKIADLKNIGGSWGGACTAASFLEQFVGDKKWAHLDMAGVDLFEKATNFSAEGSSGFGVRLLTNLVANLAGK